MMTMMQMFMSNMMDGDERESEVMMTQRTIRLFCYFKIIHLD